MKKRILLSLITVILIILLIFLLHTVYAKYRNKAFVESTDISLANKLKTSPFKINKIILYSSGFGKNKNVNFQTSEWILDIYQYTDIALYLEGSEAIKKLSISDFKSDFGNLYYLDATKFGTEEILKDYEINPSLEYTILNDTNEKNLMKYNTPIFFSDCSNPITLKFVNTIAKNFVIENTEKLKFDGSLLEKTNTTLNSLKAKLSFVITITDYSNKEFNTTIQLNIPIENNHSNIFQGHILERKDNQNIIFLNNEV